MSHRTRIKTQKTINQIDSIEGWLSRREGIFLYRLVRSLPINSVIVEIGSFKGKSTIWLGSSLKNKSGSILYSIDPHVGSPEIYQEYQSVDTFPEFQKNLIRFRVKEKVKLIRKDSNTAVLDFKRKINLLFIDGSHEYHQVYEDFQNWSPKIVPGGWVVFHDATVLAGPWKVARDNLVFSDDYVDIGMLGSMIYGKYLPANSLLVKEWRLFDHIIIYLYIIFYVILRKMKNVMKRDKTG